MKAITISQPYASLIASGQKWIENRSWPTTYTGPLAIHAGKGLHYLDRKEIKEFPTGSIIATAKLSGCVVREQLQRMSFGDTTKDQIIPGCKVTWKQACDHAYTEGPWCWILEDIQAIEQIEIRGARQLWDVPPEVVLVLAR